MNKISILKQREISDKKNLYQKLFLLSDNIIFLANTTTYKGKSITMLYAVLGFDEIGEIIYNTDGMKIGESENNKSTLNNFTAHIDAFFNKIENNTDRYKRIKEALF